MDMSLAGTGSCKLLRDRFSWNDQRDSCEKGGEACDLGGRRQNGGEACDLGGRRQNCKCQVPPTATRHTTSCADL